MTTRTSQRKPGFFQRFNLVTDLREHRVSYLMMAPFLVLFTLLVVVPVVQSIVLSFYYFNVIETPRFIGWSNYQQLLLEDDVFLIALKNTLLFAAITGPLSYFLCLMLAWIINELRPKVRSFATLLFYAPSISGNVYFIWLFIFSGDSYGLVNGFLMRLNILKEPIQYLADPRYNFYVIMLVQLWMSLGTSFLSFIAGLQGVDRQLYEAGAVDGIKNRFQELFYITLPSMKPQLLFGAVLQVAASFSVGEISKQMAGFPSPLYSAHTIILHMEDYGTLRYEMGYASAIAVVLFLITVGLNTLVRRAFREEG